MALNLDTLLADYNGTSMAIAGHAEWGFVGREWFLAVPKNAKVPTEVKIGLNGFGGTFNEKEFIMANFHHVRGVAGSNETALFIAMLRAHLVRQGMAIGSLAERAVIEDEYVVVDPKSGGWDHADNAIPNMLAAPDIARFVKQHGNTIVHQMVYVFSARGHHWDAEYNALYDRLKKACFIVSPGTFSIPANEILYRLAIHAFGIKLLTQLTMRDRDEGKMAAAMYIRFNPMAPLAGTAQITTTAATLRSMKQEAWWVPFEAKFHDSIEEIETEVGRIVGGGYEYHVAAKVFGFAKRKMVRNEATEAFNVLCQFALGYIDHLGRKHSLSGQHAITQKSGGPRGMADAFARACDRFGKPDANVATMTQFLANI